MVLRRLQLCIHHRWLSVGLSLIHIYGGIPIILYNYTPTRAGSHAAAFLAGADPGYYLMAVSYTHLADGHILLYSHLQGCLPLYSVHTGHSEVQMPQYISFRIQIGRAHV